MSDDLRRQVHLLAAVGMAQAALVIMMAAASLAAGTGRTEQPTPYWLGASFDELPLTYEEPGFYIYGDCDVEPGSDSGCAPPLEVQNRTTCERNPVAIDVPADRLYKVRGGAIAAMTNGNGIDLLTARSTVTVYGDSAGREARAVQALRRRSMSAPPDRLRPPQFPRAALAELKRVVVARRHFGNAKAIQRATGVPVAHVRLRLRLAGLLGSRALQRVSAPRRSYRQVQRDRQIAFTADEFSVRSAAREFQIKRSEVRRATQRVRGLVAHC